MRAGALALATALLAGCASGAPDEARPTGPDASGTPSQAPTASPTTTPRLDEQAAITECGDALYYWYPSGDLENRLDGDNDGDGWNWRFTGETREVTMIDTEWRVVFTNTAAERDGLDPESRIVIDGVEQDGFADTWCETNADGTFDVGIVGGASLEGATMEQLAQFMIERDREYLEALG